MLLKLNSFWVLIRNWNDIVFACFYGQKHKTEYAVCSWSSFMWTRFCIFNWGHNLLLQFIRHIKTNEKSLHCIVLHTIHMGCQSNSDEMKPIDSHFDIYLPVTVNVHRHQLKWATSSIGNLFRFLLRLHFCFFTSLQMCVVRSKYVCTTKSQKIIIIICKRKLFIYKQHAVAVATAGHRPLHHYFMPCRMLHIPSAHVTKRFFLSFFFSTFAKIKNSPICYCCCCCLCAAECWLNTNNNAQQHSFISNIYSIFLFIIYNFSISISPEMVKREKKCRTKYATALMMTISLYFSLAQQSIVMCMQFNSISSIQFE